MKDEHRQTASESLLVWGNRLKRRITTSSFPGTEAAIRFVQRGAAADRARGQRIKNAKGLKNKLRESLQENLSKIRRFFRKQDKVEKEEIARNISGFLVEYQTLCRKYGLEIDADVTMRVVHTSRKLGE